MDCARWRCACGHVVEGEAVVDPTFMPRVEAHKAECHPRPPMVSEQSCCSGIFRAEDAKFLAHIAAQLPTEPRCEVCGAPVAEGMRAYPGLAPCWREVWRRDHPEVK